MPILLGATVLILLLWAGSAFSKADPKQAARFVRYIGGGAALVILAVGTELSQLLAGTSGQGIDHSAARKLALRICGYPAGATAHGRYSSLGR